MFGPCFDTLRRLGVKRSLVRIQSPRLINHDVATSYVVVFLLGGAGIIDGATLVLRYEKKSALISPRRHTVPVAWEAVIPASDRKAQDDRLGALAARFAVGRRSPSSASPGHVRRPQQPSHHRHPFRLAVLAGRQ